MAPDPTQSLHEVFQALTEGFPQFTPQLQRAARHVLDNPADVAVFSMRRLAGRAAVTPSTMVRLVKEIGFDSYDAFRALFQNAMRQRAEAYQDRARWLQALARSADGALVSRCAAAHLGNLEQAYAETVPEELTAAAATLAQAERTFVLALRGGYALGHYFHYVGRMAMPNLVLSAGRTAHDFDELALIGPRDALLALAFRPYARETVKIARFAVERGATLVAVTDSRVSPLALGARHVLVAPTASPHFFPSLMPAMALMETLVAAIISAGDRQVIDQIAAYDRLHEALDVYWSEP